MSKVTITQLVPNYSEARFREATEVLKALHQDTTLYVNMDNLYDVEGLENVKRSMTANLELLGEHYARAKKFKTIGDYLEEHRKALKADTIDLIVAEGKGSVSVNQAEKIVYNHKYYKDRIEVLTQLKSFFIKVEIMYERYVDTLNNVRQSISLCRKDPNFKPLEDE